MTVAEAMKKRRLGIQNRKVKAIFLSSGKALTMFTVITGEEDDYTIHQVRSKLFSLENGEWKERGTGVLKLNVRDSDGAGARLGLYVSPSTGASPILSHPSQLCAGMPFVLFF